MSWTTALASVKQDIFIVSLVCKQFRSASFESFGTILGERRFRLTETGLQDLQDILKVKELVPWIKTLTFGTAQLSQSRTEYFFDPSHVERFPEIAQQAGALWSARSKYMARQQSVDYKSALSQVLVAFQNLRDARIVVVDKADYLGGWLTPELRRSAEIYRNVVGPKWWTEPYISRPRIAGEVLEAFVKAGLSLNDLKFSLQTPILSCPLPTSLHTLRITVCKDFFTNDSHSTGVPSFLIALERMTGLKELAIHLDTTWYKVSWYYYDTYDEYMTENLVKALEKATRLRDVVFEGNWTFIETCLIAFVQRHASSLRNLTLYNCVLRQDWDRVLRAIADLTRGHLEHLSVIYPLSAEVGRPVVSEDYAATFVNEWPQFSCATHIGPDVLLQNDIDTHGGITGGADVENVLGVEEDGGEEDKDVEEEIQASKDVEDECLGMLCVQANAESGM
jgi:hypothetical protein